MPKFGSQNHNAKLSDDDVRSIRSEHMAYVRGRGYKALAKKYSSSESTIRDIVTYRTRRNA